MTEFIKLISCPVTKKIFCTPVMASDNIIYEAEIAFKLIEDGKVSPITNELLEPDIKIVINLKSLIDIFIRHFQGLKEHRYRSEFDITKIYHFSKAEILSIFTERENYNGLLKYDSFKIEDIEHHSFANFLKFAPYEVITHFIDRCNNLQYVFPNVPGTWNIINYVLRYSSLEVVKYVLTKYPNLDYEHESSDGWKPIHQVSTARDGECVRLLIDNGVDLLTRTSEGITGLEYILTNLDVETVMYTIEKND